MRAATRNGNEITQSEIKAAAVGPHIVLKRESKLDEGWCVTQARSRSVPIFSMVRGAEPSK